MAEATVELNELDFAGDDRVVPFQVEGLDVRGRAVQLGPLLNTILERHEYPAPVARLLSEAIVLTALLGTSLKFDGKFTVQTKSDGPVDLLVADFSTPQSLRAYARYNDERLAEAVEAGETTPPDLLGEGILAFTTLSMVPALVFYAFAERHLVRGLTTGAVKGSRAHRAFR